MIEWIMNLAPAWAQAHAPALIVLLPLLAAPISAFLPGAGRLAWLLTVLVTGLCALLSIVLLGQVQSIEGGAIISYSMGGWAPPHGIEFRIDSLNVLIIMLVSAIAFLTSIFGWPTVKAEINEEKRAMFFAAFQVCFMGLLGVASTGDAFNLFVFLELSSIATYVLVALGSGRDRRALPAALNYLLMGTIGASFYVVGVGFLYAATGTLNMADLAVQLQDVGGNRVVQVGFAFILVGLGLKAAMFPLHQWLPNAYAYSPSFVTAFLAATATKVAIYALVRFLFSVFSLDFAFEGMSLSLILAPMGIAAMLACSFQAIFQLDVRRTLAYSSVAQVGYMLLGISLGTAAGVSAGLFHLVNHAVIKGALFMAVAGVVLTYQGTRIHDFRGLGRSAPWTMTAFAIAALSLIGVPLTAGFQSKFALVSALLESGWWWAALIVVFSSVLAVIYMGRILEAVFFRAPANPQKAHKEAPLLLLIPLWVLVIANIWIGVQGSFVAGLANDAAASLFIGGAR
ncbi:monovalent cation/H+ antiporter subunit D family protein [Henriciella litoralis]|uniref:monovalent cation/H+ antiporter subunit D family protein n=1 Tax=Henriciella litoralis TaxID=568102 RepID=UPI00146AB9D8|nr:monovalent cation/H+ antiporter subunit D family protein [Henriciella litoralis]